MRPSAAEVIETSTSNNLPLREFKPNPDPRETCAYTKKLLTSGEISFDSNQESSHLGIADYLSKHCVCKTFVIVMLFGFEICQIFKTIRKI